MHRVLLLGDSIRIGYEPAVRAVLADIAIVRGPMAPTLHTVDLLTQFWTGIVAERPDVVHLNAGHWDTRRVVRGHEGNIVLLEDYGRNLRRLFRLFREHTEARIIWATTTPAIAQGFEVFARRHGLPGRNYADTEPYNAMSRDIAREMGVPINDLAAFVEKVGIARMLSPDGIHFTPEGYEQLGQKVAQAIQAQLTAAA